MKQNNLKIEYKVKFWGIEAIETKTPTSIARMISGDGTCLIEYCNPYHGWIENPGKISMWMGSADEGYFSPPDGDDMPQEFIDEWIAKWSKNWKE